MISNHCHIVDAVELDKCNFKLHHILIDNEGVPEVKIQIGDRYFILHTDPVDVREVVHGRWERAEDFDFISGEYVTTGYNCNKCGCYYKNRSNYCPNCGADMRERKDND